MTKYKWIVIFKAVHVNQLKCIKYQSSYFSVAVVNYHDQGKLREEKVYLGLQSQRDKT